MASFVTSRLNFRKLLLLAGVLLVVIMMGVAMGATIAEHVASALNETTSKQVVNTRTNAPNLFVQIFKSSYFWMVLGVALIFLAIMIIIIYNSYDRLRLRNGGTSFGNIA